MAAVSIRPITKDILGSADPATNCVTRTLAPMDGMDSATYIPNVVANAPRFRGVAAPAARVGIFAVEARGVTRAILCVLPETNADRVMYGVLPTFGQSADYYLKLGGGQPLSPPLIKDTLALLTGEDRDGKVAAVYGTQVLSSSRPMALLVPVRVLTAATDNRDAEMGPFAYDGEVIADTLTGIAAATGGGFSTDIVEAFTHSNGILAFNAVLKSVAGKLNVRYAYGLDPAQASPIRPSEGTNVRQYLSGQTGGIVNGRPAGNFEYMPIGRWQNEPQREHVMRMWNNDLFTYLHNYAFPRYLLRFSLETTMG